jgi:Pyruvate dehydrogenase complex, dehydrogenase (E1) component
LKALVDEKSLPAADLVKAMEKYGINPEKPNPRLA